MSLHYMDLCVPTGFIPWAIIKINDETKKKKKKKEEKKMKKKNELKKREKAAQLKI